MNLPQISTNDVRIGEREAAAPLLQRILDTARESVIVVDSSIRIKAANRAARTAFARSDGTLEDRRLSEVIRDVKLHEIVRSALSDSVASDIRLEIAANEKRSYDIHVAPFELEGSRHAICFFYDITHIERLEKVRQEFLSNISHELRTPLTSIIAFVETLEDGAIDDRENNRHFLSVIHRNADRMHSLIADILELSLIESGNVSIEKSSVRLAHLVDDVFEALSSKANAREISLSRSIDEDRRVNADPRRLEQMITNLVDNAIKFNRRGGSVRVALEAGESTFLMTVADTGEGIMPEHLDRIFERFYRLDRGRTREVGGTGLGLAIVKHLARLQGGEVSARSELGVGTTFFVELPV